MIATLRIRNFALVEKLEWNVPRGFVAITGETGAGKSILIGALKLLLGERADRGLIRSGASECSVEVVIQLSEHSEIPGLLEAAGIDPCEDGVLILKRVLSVSGAGKHFVNGSPCTLTLLRSIGDCLVDLHGPHDHQSLFSQDAQVRLLDAFAGAEQVWGTYEAHRKRLVQMLSEQERLVSETQAILREIDLLEYQLQEIDGAELHPDEEEPLLARYRAASNAQRLQEGIALATNLLVEADHSVERRLADALRLLRDLVKVDGGLESIVEQTASTLESVADIAHGLEIYAQNLSGDLEALSEMQDRLDRIGLLKRKYGPTLVEVIAFGEVTRQRLEMLRGRDARRSDLDAEIQSEREAVFAIGKKLSALRKKAAPLLAERVRHHLRDLGFLQVGFDVVLKVGVEPLGGGFETVEFVFSPNPGEAPLPLRSIASSGEISRVMLALKTSLASEDRVPILVFDEIDANVGGEVAHAVGAKMREVGASRQVLCITHLPQVAAAANAHFAVRKEVIGERTQSQLICLTERAREEEIARMLGSRSGATARAHARELIASG